MEGRFMDINTFESFGGLREIKKVIRSRRRTVSVIFIDLNDSTQYKVIHGDMQGLERTFIHNTMCSDIIEKCKGKIVKYIGDEIMAIFDNNNMLANVVKCAFKIQNYWQKFEEKQYNIKPKIGINYGNIYFWNYTKNGMEDPQGEVVDLASRLVSIAKNNQILLPHKLSQKLRGFNFSKPYKVELKGFKNDIAIVEVFVDTPLGIKDSEHINIENKSITDALNHFYKNYEEGKCKEALPYIDLILRDDARHTVALYYKGEFYGRRMPNLKVDEAIEILLNAYKRTKKIPKIPLQLGFLYWKKFEATKQKSFLENAITYTDIAFKKSRQCIDKEVERLSLNNLSYYYVLRNNKGDVQKSLEICKIVKELYKEIRESSYGEFLDTYALALMTADKNRNKDKIISLLRESIKICPENPYPYEKLHIMLRESGKGSNDYTVKF